VYAPGEDQSDDSKYSIYEELEQIFNHFPKYHTKIQLGDLNAKVGQENIFRQLGMRVYVWILMIMVLE
jgi:hypothetical protein